MTGDAFFSPDYCTARQRFRRAVDGRCMLREELPVGDTGPQGEELTIDTALMGSERPARVIVVSGGLHGVEGFLGSAVQLALLEGPLKDWTPPAGTAVVLLHGLDPYGFAWIRRTDRDNIDLNRNFLLPGESYTGCPEMYRTLDFFLNPPCPPSRWQPFLPRALWTIARHGMANLKQAVAGGQYEYPRGLFFGGRGPSTTQRMLAQHLPRWLAGAEQVMHLDIHSGLGKWGTYKLLIERSQGMSRLKWLIDTFGADAVERQDHAEATAYPARGLLDPWCAALMPGCHYDFFTAEFGTYSPVTVTAALRAENQAHHWGDPTDPATHWAKQRLLEAFVPASPQWRTATVRQGVEIVTRAMEACLG